MRRPGDPESVTALSHAPWPPATEIHSASSGTIRPERRCRIGDQRDRALAVRLVLAVYSATPPTACLANDITNTVAKASPREFLSTRRIPSDAERSVDMRFLSGRLLRTSEPDSVVRGQRGRHLHGVIDLLNARLHREHSVREVAPLRPVRGTCVAAPIRCRPAMTGRRAGEDGLSWRTNNLLAIFGSGLVSTLHW